MAHSWQVIPISGTKRSKTQIAHFQVFPISGSKAPRPEILVNLVPHFTDQEFAKFPSTYFSLPSPNKSRYH
jgi:hypothetical protein